MGPRLVPLCFLSLSFPSSLPPSPSRSSGDRIKRRPSIDKNLRPFLTRLAIQMPQGQGMCESVGFAGRARVIYLMSHLRNSYAELRVPACVAARHAGSRNLSKLLPRHKVLRIPLHRKLAPSALLSVTLFPPSSPAAPLRPRLLSLSPPLNPCFSLASSPRICSRCDASRRIRCAHSLASISKLLQGGASRRPCVARRRGWRRDSRETQAELH